MVAFIDTAIKLLTDSLLNCSNSNTLSPTASSFLSQLDTPYVFALIIATLTLLGTIGLFILQLLYIGRYCTDVYRRAFILFLAGTPVFVSFFAVAALFMPRIWFLGHLLSFFYFSISLYVTICLMLHLMNGRQAIVKKMAQTSVNMSVQTPPFCCIFPCLPELPVQIKRIRFCELMVMQTPIVRLIFTVISLILYFEYFDKAFVALKILDFFSLPSILLAIYGLHILSTTVAKLDEISHSKYTVVFRLVDIYFMIFGLQTPIFDFLARAGVFGCGSGLLNALDTAFFWKNFAIVCESFIISVLSSWLLKPAPTRSGLFDKYNASCRSVHSMTTVSTIESST